MDARAAVVDAGPVTALSLEGPIKPRRAAPNYSRDRIFDLQVLLDTEN